MSECQDNLELKLNQIKKEMEATAGAENPDTNSAAMLDDSASSPSDKPEPLKPDTFDREALIESRLSDQKEEIMTQMQQSFNELKVWTQSAIKTL